MIKLSTEVGYDDKYDHHEVLMRSIGVYPRDNINEDMNFLSSFKEKIMPIIRKLRETIIKYEDYKARALDIAKIMETLLECCINVCKCNPVVCEYLGLRKKFNAIKNNGGKY